MKLTERWIERLVVESSSKDRLVFDDEQRGLAVRVTSGGGRTYLAQYTLHGQKWRVPLGACSAVTLAKAREAAAAVMGDVAKGRNPAADRKAAAAAERAKRARNRLTLRVLIADWKRLHLTERRPRYAAEAVRALHYAFADHIDDAAEDLDRAAVVRTLDSLIRRRQRKASNGHDKRKGTAILGRTAAYGRAAYAWAVKRGAVKTNPFLHLPISKSVGKRDRVLSDEEIGEVWRAAGDVALPYGMIVRLLILTGQRKTEVSAMTWRELSDDISTWTIPADRTKNGVVHVVPLSASARDLIKGFLPEDPKEGKRQIEKLRRTGALVMPGAFGTPYEGWSKAKLRLDNAIGDARGKAAAAAGTSLVQMPRWSLQDLRRTVATGLQRLGVRLEVTEAILNHISGTRGGIAGVYQRHDWATEKRSALDAWGAHVLATVEPQTTNRNILKLPRAS
jgi:integrase